MISGLPEMCASVLHCWNSENVLNVQLRQETPEYRPLPLSAELKLIFCLFCIKSKQDQGPFYIE